jgi:hypothetical protein
MTYVKEQAPLKYAWRLARNGYAALIFDSRYRDKLHLRPDTPHLDFYDIPVAIDLAVTSISDWFARHLGTGK